MNMKKWTEWEDMCKYPQAYEIKGKNKAKNKNNLNDDNNANDKNVNIRTFPTLLPKEEGMLEVSRAWGYYQRTQKWKEDMKKQLRENLDWLKKSYKNSLGCAHYNFSQLVEDAIGMLEEALGEK